MLRVGGGAAPLGCIVRDISETGARLALLGGESLPEQFDLVLSPNGAVNRLCHVIWRSDREVGVKFIPRPAPPARL